MPFDVVKYTADFFKLPRPANQSRWVREYDEVTIHTQGKVAERLIKTRRPYEDKEVSEYRLANYEPITKGPFRRFKTNLSRVFSASQVSIQAGNETVQTFIDGPNFSGMSLRSYWSRKLTGRMIDDPNGFLVWWVDVVPEAPNERVQPVPHLVLAKNVLHLTDEVFSWLSNEKSMVSAPDPAGGGERLDQPLGDVYYIITKDTYFKFRQVGKLEERVFEMVRHYNHNIGAIPVRVLGGEETTTVDDVTNEDVTWFTSWVSNAIPYANECARQWSDHQGVLIVSGFPLREMAPVKCTHTGCRDGFISEKLPNSDISERHRCPTCKGRGKVPPVSTYGVLLREQASVLSGGAKTIDDRDMIKYLNPDPAILEFGSKTWREYKADTEKELDLVFVEDAQSGVAKDIDREPKVAKLDLIGHHLFLVNMQWSIDVIGKLMNAPVQQEDIVISLPATFIVRTEEDLTAEAAKWREAFGPSNIAGQQFFEFVQRRFSGDRDFIKQNEILLDYDPMYGWTPEEVSSALSASTVDSVLVRRHQLAPNALRRMVREEGPEVLDGDDIFELIDDAVEELMPQARIDAEKPDPLLLAGAGGFPKPGGFGKPGGNGKVPPDAKAGSKKPPFPVKV